VTRAYEEIIDFIAGGSTPLDVVAFEPSAAAKARVEELIRREKTSSLTPEEVSELDNYMHLEHLMRLAKAKARRHLRPRHE
jgi:hypothetical protein